MTFAAPIADVQRRTVARPTGVGLSNLMERVGFGELVRRYRKLRGLTQEQLAEKVGSDKGYMSRLEGDFEKQPGHEMAQKLIAALDAPSEPFLRALNYSIGAAGDPLAAFERAVIEEPTLSEEHRQILLTVVRDLFARWREQTA